MGFMEKLKNIFFEEEEEEEEIQEIKPPKKEKDIIATKVDVPKRKKENIEVEEIKREEVLENNFQEIQKEVPNNYSEIKKEPLKSNVNNDLIFDEEDFIVETKKPKKETATYSQKEVYKNLETNLYKGRENRNLNKKEEIKEKKEPVVSVKYEMPLYSEKKETKTFTPSPIISPIYGILDKNYKKEEVKERKEVRISSRPVKMDLDSVRNKAFGELEYDLFDNTPTKEEIEEAERRKKETPKREIRKIYDMSKDEKPSIDKVTLGEADEYFNDLGLAYNTDYKDISKEISDGKILENEIEKGDSLEDNLFDLIESMYDKED